MATRKKGLLQLVHPALHQLLANPAVRRIYPVYEVARPQWFKESDSGRRLPFEDSLSQISRVHQELGLTGTGMTIGILDSGVDYEHPALGGGFGPGYKFQLGHNLVSPADDDKDAGSHRPENDPYDVCTSNEGGHGTHVSGIIGGVYPEKNFVGVAPNATLGMWRIFGCTGGAGEDTVIKAMEMAYAAGCDVINLSLGVQNAWPEDPMAVVADRLSQKGVTVVSVAGNQGTEGAFMQNSPASGSHAVSVASVDNTFHFTKVMLVQELPNDTFPFQLSTSTSQMVNGTLAIVNDNSDQVTQACANDTISDAKDKVLLVRRGGCTYDDKAKAAAAAGAIAVLFYDAAAQQNGTYETPISAKTSDVAPIPCAGITLGTAQTLMATNASLHVLFPAEEMAEDIKSAGQVSSFSSVGPTYELDLKPSLAGIGGQVYSTLPRHISNGWGTLSGTSMASPHVAGVMALMKEWHKRHNRTVDTLYITEQLQNYGRLAQYEGHAEHPLKQGAGLVQPYDAIMNGDIHVSPGYLSFNDTSRSLGSRVLHVHNGGQEPARFELRHLPSKAVTTFANDSTFAPSEPAGREDVQVELMFTPPRLTLQPGQSADVHVTVIDLPAIRFHYQMYGGYIELTRDSGNASRVPYFGVLGEMIKLPLFDTGFPYLASSNNDTIKYETTDVYNFNTTQTDKQPQIVLRLLSPTAQAVIDVIDTRGASLGQVTGGPFTYWERNHLSGDDYYRTVPWDGKVVADYTTADNPKQVQHGTYRLRVRALKVFGDPNKPDNWEEWSSGPILLQ
ncbi:peptidase S8/S53 domain-containing protein [Syncephalastrum racemosum]|uniref:Peptidase S8/S53 domain-containing protein n=1 Tax=Syncephalastrum racemosum TaxID=13706 RepID=A0A1X2HGB3_SYNRA|nr:peptidase S8/S53 domain-containing protein [Syncephalastrum racemosum]